MGALNFFLWTFLGGRVHWTKKRSKAKIIIWIFFKKSPFLRKPYSFSAWVEDRVCDRRLAWPLLRVETSLMWLKQSSLRTFRCHWSRPRDIRCIKPSLSFSLFFFYQNRLHVKKYFLKNSFFDTFCYLPIVVFLISLLQLFFKIKKFHRGKVTFFLFSFPCFYFHFSSPFFSPYVLPRRSDGRGQDTSPREMSEGNGGNGHQDLKRKSLVGVIWAWLKLWVDGPEFTNENASILMFRQGLAATVCFLWLSDKDSPRDIRLWRPVVISLVFLSLSVFFILFMFTLFTRDVAKGWQKDWATWGGGAEPRRSDGLCRRSKEDRARKTKNLRKGNSMTWKSKQAKWQIESPRLSSTTKSTWRTTMKGSSLCPTKLGRRTSQTILKERICQITEARWMHPCNVLERDKIHWTKMRCGLERWWSVGLMEETDGKTDTEKRPNEKYGRDKTEVWEMELFNSPMVLLKVVQEPVVVPEIQFILQFVMERQVPSKKSVQKLWRFRKAQYNDKAVNVFLVMQTEAFSHHPKQKKKAWLNPPERLVKSQIACVVEIVLCEMRLGRKPRSVSSHLHYLLFSLIWFWQMSFPAFFTTSHHVLKTFSNVLPSSFENVSPQSLHSDRNIVLFFLERSSFFFSFFQKMLILAFFFDLSLPLPYFSKLNLFRKTCLCFSFIKFFFHSSFISSLIFLISFFLNSFS